MSIPPRRATIRGCRPLARRGSAASVSLAALWLAVAVSLLAGPTAAQASIGSRLTDILVANYLAGPRTGVVVRDLGGGGLIYERNPGARLMPASNMKLVTSATALLRLGPYYRFKTELYLPAVPPDSNGVLRGNVYLKGYGDPTLSTGSYQRYVLHLPTAKIGSFVRELRELGVTSIKGRIVGDETYFDRLRTAPVWSQDKADWCGPLSALSLNEGLSRGVRVSNPPRFVARTLTQLLENAGIEVTGSPSVGRVPARAFLYYTEYSAELQEVVYAMNKPSDNFIAEMLTKQLGRQLRGTGSTAAGCAASAAFLADCGLKGGSYSLRDGSGLSHDNRLTAAGVARLLAVMAVSDWYPYFWFSLAEPGSWGTLDDRMIGTAADGNLHAKTGTLSGASNLSGYVTTRRGRHLAFSILMNGSGLSVLSAHRAQDAMAIALAAGTF